MITHQFQIWRKKQRKMNIEAFEKSEQLLKLRERVLQAEQERIDGAKTYSISEARRQLRERIDGV